MTAPLDILSLDQMRACDQAAIASGTPGIELMTRAGQAVAKAVMARWPQGPVLVLCGPGNNGGDGFVAAQGLAQAGWPVRLALACPVAALKGDAAIAASHWTGPVESFTDLSLDGITLVIDALFGAGLSKPLETSLVQVLKGLEAAGLPIIAIDLPSGLSGDTARLIGDYAPVCAATITFHRKKPAHVLTTGRQYCGEVILADIGLLPGLEIGRAHV